MSKPLPTRWPQVVKTKVTTTTETTRIAFTMFDFCRMIKLYMPIALEGIKLDKIRGLPIKADVCLHFQTNDFGKISNKIPIDPSSELVLTVTRQKDV